jgi:hypothetical protein
MRVSFLNRRRFADESRIVAELRVEFRSRVNLALNSNTQHRRLNESGKLEWSSFIGWPLSLDRFVLIGVGCVALLGILATLMKVGRSRFNKLQLEVRQLAERTRTLEAAEQRRLANELRSNRQSMSPPILPTTEVQKASAPNAARLQ